MPTSPVDKPSIAQSFWLDQPTGVAFRNTETAIQKQTEQVNLNFSAVNTSIDTINTAIDTINTDLGNKVTVGSPLSVMGPTTSAQLAGIMTDETGSGALVFGTSPTLATPTINDATANFGTYSSPTITTPTIFDPVITSTITIPNTGLHLLDTNASHDLIIQPGSNLTADRILTITTGDANRALDLSANLIVTAATTLAGAASDTVAGPIEIATQAEMETPSSTTLAVTPGRAHFHPGVAKFWVFFIASGAIAASHNVTSITKHATGQWTVNLTNGFNSANWCVMAIGGVGSTTALVYNVAGITASTVRIHASNLSLANEDPASIDAIFVVGFGDFA